MLKKDALGHIVLIKRMLFTLVGLITYRRYNGFNDIEIVGTEVLHKLPDKGVVFISNHQTYFADVICLFHIFFAVNNGRINSLKNPLYTFKPKTNLFYVAAAETMNKGFLPRLFKYGGCVTVKRAWREAGKTINRQVDLSEVQNIYKAIESGWVINFPQGTTKAFAPGRKGTVRIIQDTKPIVIPVVLDGFRRAFDKKGLITKKKGVKLRVQFKEPLELDPNVSKDIQLREIMDAIEQSPEFNKVPPREPKKPTV